MLHNVGQTELGTLPRAFNVLVTLLEKWLLLGQMVNPAILLMFFFLFFYLLIY